MLTTKKITFLALLIRILLFLLGLYIDKYTPSSYTDIDYKVFTDGASYLLSLKSPYNRHTYRYTPLLALIMTPNIFLNENFGKIFFIILDLICGFLIFKINNLEMEKKNIANLEMEKNINLDLKKKTNNNLEMKKKNLELEKKNFDLKKKNINLKKNNFMLLIWFFNPLTICLSTRGSSDVVVSALILMTIYFLVKNRLDLSAIFYGFTVHFKIYPIVYCIAIYLFVKKDRAFFNLNSIRYGVISGFVFFVATFFFYPFFGWEYLYESFFYHLIRKDHRHNFSIQFLYIYSSFFKIDKIISMILFLPSILLISVITYKFYKRIVFCCFLLTYVFVIFNKVVTAQYFVWYIQFVPIFFYDTKIYRDGKNWKTFSALVLAWFLVVVGWNNLAFRFEAKSQDVFYLFHFVNIVFFLINIFIVKELIQSYDMKVNHKQIKSV